MSETNLEKVTRQLQELSVHPKRSLGQNFLIGSESIAQIIQRVKHIDPARIMEVGPGLGALTEFLKGMDRNFSVIELDRAFAEYWRKQEVHVYEGDALKFNWREFRLDSCCLVSNLPYQISSSLVIERSVEPFGVNSMVLMFQKEVAQRIKAEPKTKSYGLLSVIAQAAWDIEKLLDAGPKEFFPAPNVASRVLVFTENRQISEKWPAFLSFVKAGFAQRRKLLLSNLAPVFAVTGKSKEWWEVQLVDRGYSSKARAEEISVKDWVELFKLGYF